MTTAELPKSYDPTEVEPRWYAEWTRRGYFRAEDTGDPSRTFAIAMPPPNITGSLHMGHALFCTLQDALVRAARMRGQNTLWMPGTDHAGIATQVVVERQLRAAGTDRHALGRTAFVERVWQWKEESGSRITQQLRLMGASPDWSRERFTMDAGLSRAVREAFVRLYDEGLIYRDNRLVNWCVSCRTVISDLEVDREENPNGELFEFAYPFADGSGELVVATTRPETILGDTAVAVHPDDPRYKSAIGKQLKAPFAERTIPVIADAILVDPKFGTGAVKVTPAHDFNDYETGKRHGLAQLNVLNPDGTLNANGGRFAGLDRFKARKEVKLALEQLGLVRGAKRHTLAVGKCSRSGDVLEPLLSPQWYVKMQPLAAPAIAAVREGRTTFTPAFWTETYMNWMTNIQDWCVSRQLWWGHQIPAWFCAKCTRETVAREAPAACAHCSAPATALTQDPDVLDTWFSSGLWPFSTLGWPDDTAALKTFYPGAVMETGHDILFFWVARMMMFGIHFMKDVPFRRVLLHGMVCDETGEKMSKVKVNVIDPLDVVLGATTDQIVEHAKAKEVSLDDAMKKFRKAYPAMAELRAGFEKHGADALRFYLATYPPQSARIHLQLRQLERARNFANKIWNATRFALPYLTPLEDAARPAASALSSADRWILSRLGAATEEINRGLDEFRLDECTSAARRFFWDELCDWYLELLKPVFSGTDTAAQHAARWTLGTCLDGAFRLLHPFMPFITEEVWQRLPACVRAPRSDGAPAEHLIVARFPAVGEYPRDEAAERDLSLVQSVIVAARNLRSETGIKARDPIALRLRADSADTRALLTRFDAALRPLTAAREVSVEPIGGGEKPRGVGYAVVAGVEVLVPLAGLIDPATEITRLERDLGKTRKDVEKLEKQLANPSFVERANPEAVTEARAQLAAAQERIARLESALVTVRGS